MPESTQVVRYGRDQFIQHEATADAEVYAGDLVEETATGVQPHGTDASGGAVVDRTLVALDRRMTGMELGDSYPSGDDVVYVEASAGGVHMNLAAGENVTENTRLVSNGDGALRAFNGAGGDVDGAVVAVTSEAIDNSGGAERTPIAVEAVN